MPKHDKNQVTQIRLPIMFDISDARQKAAYDILKNANYGCRTPIVVDAVLDYIQKKPSDNTNRRTVASAENDVLSGQIKDELREIVERAVNAAFDKRNLEIRPMLEPVPDASGRCAGNSTSSCETPINDNPLYSTPPTIMPDNSEESHDKGMDQLLSIADAFF